jgi:hypothetical protein
MLWLNVANQIKETRGAGWQLRLLRGALRHRLHALEHDERRDAEIVLAQQFDALLRRLCRVNNNMMLCIVCNDW